MSLLVLVLLAWAGRKEKVIPAEGFDRISWVINVIVTDDIREEMKRRRRETEEFWAVRRFGR